MVAGNTDYARHAYPAWELVRRYPRQIPRGWKEGKGGLTPVPADAWPTRWEQAGGKFYTGRMIAAKDSAVWQALGDGASGHRDTLENPFPSFAFSSGMGWKAVDREQCLSLSVIAPEETPGAMQGEMTPDKEKMKEILSNLPDDLWEEIRREYDSTGESLRQSAEEHRAQQEAIQREQIERQEEDRAAGRKMIEELMR